MVELHLPHSPTQDRASAAVSGFASQNACSTSCLCGLLSSKPVHGGVTFVEAHIARRQVDFESLSTPTVKFLLLILPLDHLAFNRQPTV